MFAWWICNGQCITWDQRRPETVWKAQHVPTIVYHNHSVPVSSNPYECVCVSPPGEWELDGFCSSLMSETQPGSLMSQLISAAQVIWAGTQRRGGFLLLTFIFFFRQPQKCKSAWQRIHTKATHQGLWDSHLPDGFVWGAICHVRRLIKRLEEPETNRGF